MFKAPPEHSYDMKNAGWIAERMGFAVVTAGLLVLGFVQGFTQLAFQIDLFGLLITAVFLNAAVSSLMFTGFFLVSAVLFAAHLRRRPDAGDGSRPLTAIIPAYRDGDALHRSVESLLNASYDELDVVVVCEEDDGKTREVAERFAGEDNVSVTVNDTSPGTKAGAINHVVESSDAERFAVFDADQLVDPDFLSTAVPMLDRYDVVQGRSVPEPGGLVESFAYYESVLFSYTARQLLQVFTGFRMAGSRAVVFTRDAFDAVGGYEPGMLTEDYYFAHDCYREGLRVGQVSQPATRIEAAHTLKDWWGQRKRWMIGYFQTFHRLARELPGNLSRRGVLSVGIAASSILGSLLMLTLVSKFLILFLLDAGTISTLPVLTVVGIAAGTRAHDALRGDVQGLGISWLLTPLIFPFFGLITVKALLEYVFTWEGEWYRVEKLG